MMSKLQKISITMIVFMSVLTVINIILVSFHFISGNFLSVFICLLPTLFTYISGAFWIDRYFKNLKEEKEIKAIQEEIVVLNALLNAFDKK